MRTKGFTGQYSVLSGQQMTLFKLEGPLVGRKGLLAHDGILLASESPVLL